VNLSPRQCFEKFSNLLTSQPYCFYCAVVEQLGTLAESCNSRIVSFGDSGTGTCRVPASERRTCISWSWPPRVLLLLSIENLGVVISALGFIQIQLIATPSPSRMVSLHHHDNGGWLFSETYCLAVRHVQAVTPPVVSPFRLGPSASLGGKPPNRQIK